MNDDEVSVRALLEREGWGDRARAQGQSRWRVVAVMLAVVVGCGVAAVLVAFSGRPDPQADEIHNVSVLPMPYRTSGYGGADESPDPATRQGGVGGGTGGTTSSRPHEHSSDSSTPTTTDAATTSARTSVVPTSDHPWPSDTTTPSDTDASPPPETSSPPKCPIWIIICL